MTRPIRFGVLGAAAIAPAALMQPARRRPDVEVVAVAARSRDRAERFARRWGVDRVHADYDAVLADPEVEAVYVPLPNGLHGRWTLAALAAGKHVLCEKPFTADAAEAATVAAAVAARPDRVVMEAFHWRYHPQHARVAALLADGAVGEVRSMSASFCVPNPRPNDIRWRMDLAGGALMDLGCYPVNMVRATLGPLVGAEPEVRRARARTVRGAVDRSLDAELCVGEVAVSLQCSMWSRRLLDVSLRVVGSEGELAVRNPVAPQLGGRIVLRRDGRRTVERAARSTSYAHQLAAFVAAVRDGAPFPSTATDAVANMAVIDDLYRAAGLPTRRPTV